MRPSRRWSVYACVAAVALAIGMPTLASWHAGPMAQAARQLGPAAEAALGPLQALLQEAAALDDHARLRLVNQFYNRRIAFAPDAQAWGQDDYWASPLQTLAQGRGDCEDYAIAKYATLLAAGTAPARLRLVYVRAQIGNQAQAHMVLAYQATPAEEPLILDNLRFGVLPAGQRADLTPVFSFNSEGLWDGTGGAAAGDPLVRLSRWRDVWARTRAEGFRGYSGVPQPSADPR